MAQLKPRAWLDMLTVGSGIDPDLHYLLDGIVNGFHVVDPNCMLIGYECSNYSTCFSEENRSKLNKIVDGEKESGKITPVSDAPLCVHALGAVKKKGSLKIRPITDCSQPELSVNNCMERVQDSFTFVTIDKVVSSIIEGKYSHMSTVDLASAYRSVMISPADRPYFGIKWEGQYYVDNFLCFGSRSAPFIFSRLTDSICRYMIDQGVMCHSYLDDIICLSRSFEEGIRDQLLLICTLRKLGFFIAWQKVTSPAPVTTYLGIVLDIENKRLSLPNDRIGKVYSELDFWVGRKKATEKQLSILIGHLCHCARIVRGGNLYLFFLFEALRESKSKRKIKLSENFHRDLSWWRLCLDRFNFAPMADISVSSRCIMLESGFFTMTTDLEACSSEINWPCVRVVNSDKNFRADLSLSQECFVGYYPTEDGLELFLPECLVGDEVAHEVCTLWACVLFFGNSDCRLTVICRKKSTWLCLKKGRHTNDMIAYVLRHLFWWAMDHNIKYEFIYDTM